MNEWQEHRWPNFSSNEMKCKESGEIKIVPSFLDKLQSLRNEYGKPMIITSGYRSPEYNNRISSTGLTGPHTSGRAVDVLIAGEDAVKLLELAFKHGFNGFGIKQHGPWSHRFIHIDDLNTRIWSYK